MKYMMSCRQTLVQLQNADEIRMDYKDIDRIRDFISVDWTCTADVVIYISNEDKPEVNWDMLKSYKDVLNIIIAIEDAGYSQVVIENGFDWFWSYPASSFWELQGLLNLGVCQVIVDAPLFFEMEKIHHLCKGRAEVRVVANHCYNRFMPREEKTGVFGAYIRPEDIPYYEPYVQHIEFETDGLKQERAYIRIYKDQGLWPGNLKILIPKLGIDVDNRGYDADFGKRRLNCRQRCQSTGRCRYCLTQPELINAIIDNMDWIKEQLN